MTPALVTILVQYALQYGIPAVLDVIALLKKPEATIADVETMFAKVKTYADYGIPDNKPAPVVPPLGTV